MISTNIGITNFGGKLRKFMFLSKIKTMKDVCRKTSELAKFELLSLYDSKFEMPKA